MAKRKTIAKLYAQQLKRIERLQGKVASYGAEYKLFNPSQAKRIRRSALEKAMDYARQLQNQVRREQRRIKRETIKRVDEEVKRISEDEIAEWSDESQWSEEKWNKEFNRILEEERARERANEQQKIMSRETYAELLYNEIMSAINRVKDMSSRRGYQGWWVVKSFIDENYSLYGSKFIISISESPYFQTLLNAGELYDQAKLESTAMDFIEQFGLSLGVDLSESFDFFGQLFDEDDIE